MFFYSELNSIQTGLYCVHSELKEEYLFIVKLRDDHEKGSVMGWSIHPPTKQLFFWDLNW